MLAGNEAVVTYIEPEEVAPTCLSFISSRMNMKLPPDFFCGDDDNQHQICRAERALHLAIFQSAFEDLVSSDPHRRRSALDWFTGQFDYEISFQDVCEIFQFNESRMNKIQLAIESPQAYFRGAPNGRINHSAKPNRTKVEPDC